QELLHRNPEEVFALNLLGYAQTFAGDFDGAQRSFEQYGREPEEEANARDSSGESMFMQGRFAEAEKSFLEAYNKHDARLGGDDLLKAAYARWLQGDLPKADELFGQYRIYRMETNDPVVFWREALWEYSTGRSAQAIARLEAITGPGANLAQK